MNDNILNDQTAFADRLRQQRQEKANAGEENGAAETENMGEDYRSVILNAKRAEAKKKEMEEKKKGKTGASAIAMSPAKKGTSWLLKASWLNLIDSFGLTLIYINMHVFLRWVFPKMFCKLGEEWVPKQASVINADAGMKATGQALGIVEVMGLLLLDLVVFFIIIGALSLLTFVVSFLGGGFLDKVKFIWDAISTFGLSAIQPLIDLFKNI